MVERSVEEEYVLAEQQLRSVLIQKEALKLQIAEIENALNELERTKEENVYKLVGSVLIKKSKDEVQKELIEIKEDVEIKIASLENVEKDLMDKIKKIEEKLKSKGG
ncbi:MAG: prefoldin subunit [Candidatus Aenigmarchaeota archaeon]|nr:prefoldin subunit [Candidatus Aenigmarchaeota archaeon]